MNQTQQASLIRWFFCAGLLLAGCIMLLAGCFLSLLVVAMLTSPGGMGAEKLLGPIAAFFALVLFIAGGWSLKVSYRLKPSSPSA